MACRTRGPHREEAREGGSTEGPRAANGPTLPIPRAEQPGFVRAHSGLFSANRSFGRVRAAVRSAALRPRRSAREMGLAPGHGAGLSGTLLAEVEMLLRVLPFLMVLGCTGDKVDSTTSESSAPADEERDDQ